MAFVCHIKAVFSEQSFAHVGEERQIIRKTISVNQARAHKLKIRGLCSLFSSGILAQLSKNFEDFFYLAA